MADRYWVGGTGTWDSSDTSHWASSSGGSPGASAPTDADNAFFDANSGTSSDSVAVNGGSCADLTCTGFVGTLGENGSYVYVYGNLLLGSGMADASAILIVMEGVGTSTINTAGISIGLMYFDGGGTYELAADLYAGTIAFTSGATFTTNNYAVTVTSSFTSVSANYATLNLGSSTLTVTGTEFNLENPNLTVNAGTSTIVLNSSSLNVVSLRNYTYYNITLTAGSQTSACKIYGAFTCSNNLTLNPWTSSSDTRTYLFSNSITVGGTFTAVGNVYGRISVIGYFGAPITITAANVSLSYVNFFRVTGSGAASWSGTSIGDMGYNTGISFDAPRNLYYNYAAGGKIVDYNVPKWATSSGGAVAAANNPLPQDTGYIGNTGLNTGAYILTPSWFVAPLYDFGSRSNAFDYYPNGGCHCRSLVLPASMTLQPGVFRFFGDSSGGTTRYFNTGGKTITSYIEIYGDLTLSSNLTSSYTGDGIYMIYGSTFDPDYYSVTLSGGISCYDAYVNAYGVESDVSPTLKIGSSGITAKRANLLSAIVVPSSGSFPTPGLTLTGNSTTVFDSGITPSIDPGLVVNLTYAGSTGTRSFYGDNNKVDFNIVSGSDTVSMTTMSSSKSVNFTGFSGTATLPQIVYGNLTVSSGMTLSSSSTQVRFRTIYDSTTYTITTNNKTFDFPISIERYPSGVTQLNGNLTMGSNRELALQYGTFTTNNYNVTCGTFNMSYGDVRTFNMGSSVITLASTGTVWNVASTYTTINAGTSEIVLSSTSTAGRAFAGGGKTYNKLTIGGATGTSTTTITGSNVFGTIASTKLVAHTISITSGTTQTVTSWTVSGTAGNIVTLTSTGSTNHTLTSAVAGPVIVNYMTISKSTASPTATWYAVNSTDGGGNVNWTFGAPVSGNGLFFGSNF